MNKLEKVKNILHNSYENNNVEDEKNITENTIKKFIENNSDDASPINKYRKLNSINFPSLLIKFPYNILKLEIRPTYKSIYLKYKKDIKSIVEVKNDSYTNKKIGGDNIIVFDINN